MSSHALVLDHIRAERKRQIAKHGDHWRDAGTWALILNEETGEVARADLECNLLVELDHQALYEELVQTAAVAVAWAEQVRGDMLASGWPPRGPDQKHWTGMKDSCELTRRIECLTTWAVLVGRVCDGPVCQGEETVFRLDGDAVVDGQYYDKYVCVECSIAPPGKGGRRRWSHSAEVAMRSRLPVAKFSEDRRYRYLLTRRVGFGSDAVMFVMLNPSTADESRDDPTIRRCINFGTAWGYGWLYVCNLSPFRAQRCVGR